jgi:hypothetical protein
MITGGCRCGACRYTVAVDALPPVYACHCQLCQSGSGSAFSEQAVVSDNSIAATGPILDYRFVTPIGAQSHHRLCATCYTRLWNTNSARAGVALIRAGTLDDAELITPRAHIWVRRKQPWVILPEGVPTWTENAPLEQLAAVLQA